MNNVSIKTPITKQEVEATRRWCEMHRAANTICSPRQRYAKRVAKIMLVFIAGMVCAVGLVWLGFDAADREAAFYDNIRAERCKNPAPELAGYCEEFHQQKGN